MTWVNGSVLAAGTGAGAAITVPSGAAALHIATVGIYLESTAPITPPAGFTNKASLQTSATARGRLDVFWKRLTGADSGTYSFTFSSTFRSAACGLWSGRVTTGDPFDGFVAGSTAESVAAVTTLNVSATPAAALGDSVGFWTNFNGGGGFTQPTNYLERADTAVLTMCTRDAIASGATGNVTATQTISDFMKAFLGVLAADTGGGAPVKTPAQISQYAGYY